MAKKTCDPNCALCNALRMLGDKWAMSILHHLEDPLRFGELKRAIPAISEKMLIQTLRNLETHELVTRMNYGEVPPRVEYSLTKKGIRSLDIMPILKDIAKR